MCLPPERMKVTQLMSTTATHARGIFSDNVTCFGTNKCCSNWSHLSGCFKCSSLLACKAPRVQLSICFPIGPSRIHLTSSLYLCPADCFQIDITVRTSWEFSLEEVGISPTYQVTYLHRGRIKVPHLMSKRPIKCWLATLNASSAIMSHALEQINAARIGVICQGASSAPHFLLARLQGYSFQFVFQLVFPAYTLHLPSICVLPTAFKTFCSNKLGILTGRSWHFSNISSDISAWWAHESTSLDVSKASGMLTSPRKTHLLRQCHMLWKKQKLLE